MAAGEDDDDGLPMLPLPHCLLLPDDEQEGNGVLSKSIGTKRERKNGHTN